MTFTFSEYDPDQYSVIFNGIPIEGFAEDNFIHIEMQSDGFSDEVGADGRVVRIRSRDQRATVTFVLQGTSVSNKLLSAMFNADMKSPNGLGVGGLLIRDTEGISVFSGAQAWIMAMPKTTLGKRIADKEWKIRVAQLEAFCG